MSATNPAWHARLGDGFGTKGSRHYGRSMGDIDLRWTGAGLIPARHFGYWQATVPLVQVRLLGDSLTVRIQPVLFGRLVGAEALSAVPADGITAYRVRSNATWQGIEFRPRQRPSSISSHGDARLFSPRFPKRASPSPPSLAASAPPLYPGFQLQQSELVTRRLTRGRCKGWQQPYPLPWPRSCR